jgi:hypothetical protein
MKNLKGKFQNDGPFPHFPFSFDHSHFSLKFSGSFQSAKFLQRFMRSKSAREADDSNVLAGVQE